MLNLTSSVTELSGVGKTREAQLKRLGIETIKDLIFCLPRSFENRSDVRRLSELNFDSPASYVLTIASEVKSAKIRKNFNIEKFRAFDESGSCEVVFFNSPFIKDVFHIGGTFRFYGKLSPDKSKLQLKAPKYEPYSETTPLRDYVPIYPLTEGLSGKVLEKLVNSALLVIGDNIKDPLTDAIRLENSLPTLGYAIKNIHNPESAESLQKSISRLAFDEMLYFGIGVSLSLQYKTKVPGVPFSKTGLEEFTAALPYELTASQKNAINDIYSDTVIKPKRTEGGHMARILVGDVGCGKTVCAAAALYISAKSGYQSALMAPTEILARQHFAEISALFSKFGFKCELLLGSTSAKEKKRIYAAVENGEADVVIGTHALLSDKLSFKSLGLVITDEQHRFGVAQRAVLNEKNASAHMLVMSATPIPRTLALTMYGDLDVSKITEMPKGRMRVDTYVVDESYRKRLNCFIESQVSIGGQVYIVCPAIEENDGENEGELYLSENMKPKPKLKNVLNYTENLKQTFKNLNIDLLHGKIKAAEKEEIMRKFASGETHILVSTTVIEVGVNVPNASLMIIENADRYGLSQLHQLRGRVGRGTRKSYCVLVSDLNTPKANERLEVMKTTYDGFEIANRDLELRGPGDFFKSREAEGFRQSGGFEFKLAKLSDDTGLMEAAFRTAKTIVEKDPTLSLEEHAALRQEIENHIAPISASIS